MSPTPLAEWRPRLLLVLLSTTLSLVLAEAAARVFPQNISWTTGTPTMEVSPTLGWRPRPAGSQRVHKEDVEVTISVNASGLRGPDLSYEPAPGRRRLAVMGDSFAFGYYAEENETSASRLGRALRSCRVDVLNGGVPGYSTDQEWMYFSDEIRKYRPVEVLLFFFYNDLAMNVRATASLAAKPGFIWRDGVLERVPPEVRAEPEASPRLTAVTFHRSALWYYLGERLQRWRPDWALALAKNGLAPVIPSRLVELLPYAFRDASEKVLVDEMWKMTAELLRRFRDDVHHNDAEFRVFYVPASHEANDGVWLNLQRSYPGRPWRRDAVRTRLATVLRELEIPLIEATAEFASAEQTRSPAYLPIDLHWNSRGNEIAFEALLPPMRAAFGCVP